MTDWPRCSFCGKFINFDHPLARCYEVRSLNALGEMDERDECTCGPCAEPMTSTLDAIPSDT